MNPSIQDIVFAFLQTYYQRMSKDPSKVSSLYSLTAELTHINYQVDFDVNAESLPTIKLTGKENISKFFTRNNKKVSDLKVLIESCDFQTTGTSHSGILVLTTGEMFWTGTPVYRFAQSIILTPNASAKDSFDVTNDVIRFIPDNLALHAVETKGSYKNDELKPKEGTPKDASKGAPEAEEVEINNGIEKGTSIHSFDNNDISNDLVKTKTLLDDSKASKSGAKELTKEAGNQEESMSNSLQPKVTVLDSAIKNEKISENDEFDSQNEKEETGSSETTGKAPPVPLRMSWASKLAANGDLQRATAQVSPTNDPAKGESSVINNKKTNETKPVEISSRKENMSNKTTKKKPLFSNINKDGFYPIYIKGTAGLTDDKLKSVLESEFGTVMKMTISDSFAVVDFESQKSQIEALDRKQLSIGDTDLFFGRKTVKKPSSSPPIGPPTTLRSHKKHNHTNANNTNNGKRKD